MQEVAYGENITPIGLGIIGDKKGAINEKNEDEVSAVLRVLND